MSKIETVTKFNGQDVRIIKNGKLGQPWWVAKDVCDVLGLEPRDSVRYLDNDEKSYVSRKHIGLNPGKNIIIINESGLYSLILRSRKPEAKAFKRWITHDVLPMIRQTGIYIPRGIRRQQVLHDIFERELINLYSLTRWPLQREVIDISPYDDKDHVRYDLVRQNTKKYDVFEITSNAVTIEKCIETAIKRGYHQSVYRRKGKRDARIIFVAPDISSFSRPFVGYLEDDVHVGYRAMTFKELYQSVKDEVIGRAEVGIWKLDDELDKSNFPYINGIFDEKLFIENKVS